jgi:hypothetical protein
VDNSIKLKELQDVNGALRKGEEGFNLFLFFSKGLFLGEKGGWGNSTLSKGGFFLRD